MISLTFVRNSIASHGTVCKTTGFWSGRYGFESQPLQTFFNSIITTKNRDTAPLIYEKFRYQNFYETKKGSPTNFFGTGTKNFRRKIVILTPPPPQHPWTFSLLEIFWNTAWKFSFTKCFGTVNETKNFRQKIVLLPSLIFKFFRYRNFFETQKCSPTNFFGTARQQLFDGKSWYSPLLSLNFFDTGVFLKHRSVPLLIFSLLRYNNFSTENRDTPLSYL